MSWYPTKRYDRPGSFQYLFPRMMARHWIGHNHGRVIARSIYPSRLTLQPDVSAQLSSTTQKPELTESSPPDDKKLSTIRLSVSPKTLEEATRVAGDLRKRYDLLFLYLETPTPARLTAAARWAISVSKIPPHTWKAPIPTDVVEEYLVENTHESSGGTSSPIQTKDWKRGVDKFISRCDELDQRRGRRRSGLPPVDDRPRKHSRASSKASSISEGHVSPDDDGPSRKVLHDDG